MWKRFLYGVQFWEQKKSLFKSDSLWHLVPFTGMLESKTLSSLWRHLSWVAFFELEFYGVRWLDMWLDVRMNWPGTRGCCGRAAAALLTCCAKLGIFRFFMPSQTRKGAFLPSRKKTVLSAVDHRVLLPHGTFRQVSSSFLTDRLLPFPVLVNDTLLSFSCSNSKSRGHPSLLLSQTFHWPMSIVRWFDLLNVSGSWCLRGMTASILLRPLSDSFVTQSCMNHLPGLLGCSHSVFKFSTQQPRSNVEFSPFLKVSGDLRSWDSGSHWTGEVFQSSGDPFQSI